MVDPFIYHNPTKVYFGNDALSHLHEELPRWGSRVLLVYGGGSIKKNGIYDTIISEIEKAGLSGYEISGVKPNPEIALAYQGARLCREGGYRPHHRSRRRQCHRYGQGHRRQRRL